MRKRRGWSASHCGRGATTSGPKLLSNSLRQETYGQARSALRRTVRWARDVCVARAGERGGAKSVPFLRGHTGRKRQPVSVVSYPVSKHNARHAASIRQVCANSLALILRRVARQNREIELSINPNAPEKEKNFWPYRSFISAYFNTRLIRDIASRGPAHVIVITIITMFAA